jgi:hypothetical protein
MSSVVDSPAKTLVSQEKEQESQESVVDSGKSLHELLARYDQPTSSWRTAQYSLAGDSELFSETWPKWGMMLNGECWGLSMPEHLIRENAYGYLPTLNTKDSRGTSSNMEYHQRRVDRNMDFSSWVAVEFGTTGKIHPECSEIVMGWPKGQTALEPLAMDKFQQWLHSHGELYHNERP